MKLLPLISQCLTVWGGGGATVFPQALIAGRLIDSYMTSYVNGSTSFNLARGKPLNLTDMMCDYNYKKLASYTSNIQQLHICPIVNP